MGTRGFAVDGVKAQRRAALLLLMAICPLALLTGCLTDAGISKDGHRPDCRGSQATRVDIPYSGSLQNPAWSPDGAAILFTAFRNGYNEEPADLVIFDLETRSIRMLVSDGSGNVNLPGSAWNGPSGRIVFSSSREPHDEVFAIAADGSPGSETRVTHRARYVAYEPSISPDGRQVVFESHPLDAEGEGVITLVQVGGGGAYQPLTAAGEDCRQPNWSPAGDLIVYQKLAGGRWEVWVADPDGTTHRQVTGGPGDKTDASFSPDGYWIVFSSDARHLEFAELFIVPAAGGEQRQLTDTGGYAGAPSWSPDGKSILFEASPGDPEVLGTTIWLIEITCSEAASRG